MPKFTGDSNDTKNALLTRPKKPIGILKSKKKKFIVKALMGMKGNIPPANTNIVDAVGR